MPECKIVRSGNLLKVTPGYKPLLARHLYYERRERNPANPKRPIYTPTYLFREDTDGSIIVPAGLLDRVVAALRALNIATTYQDLRIDDIGEPQFGNLDPLRDGQDEVLAHIATYDMGQIEAATGFGKSFLMKQICKLWPTAPVIICAPFSGIIRQIYAELKEIFPPDQVGMVGDGKHEPDRRITCCISNSLLKCNLEKCRVFIFDECHRAAGPATAAAIACIPNARMYGFSASPTGRSDNADLETEAMFGKIILTKTYQEVQKGGGIVPMDVYVMPCYECEGTHNDREGVMLNRWGLWRNDERNKLIKDAVEWAFKTFGEDNQMLITVETTEHAVNIGHLLPGFQLVYGQMDGTKRERWERDGLIPPNMHPITSEQREIYRQEFRSGKLRRAIATGVWGTGVDFPLLNILVRADAQSGPIPNTQIPGRATRASNGKDKGIILDFNDSFNRVLNGRFLRRTTAYRKKGWKIQLIKADLARS